MARHGTGAAAITAINSQKAIVRKRIWFSAFGGEWGGTGAPQNVQTLSQMLARTYFKNGGGNPAGVKPPRYSGAFRHD